MKKYNIISLLTMFVTSVLAQQPLTLQEYRDSVAAVSREVKQAQEKIVGAEYTKKASISGYLPKTDLSGDASYDFVKTYSGEYALNPFNYSFGAVLTQHIYAGWSVISNRTIAKSQIKLAELHVDYTLAHIYYQEDVS